MKHENITHVVMESTGSYWKPEFNVWEDAVKVYLANPQDGKNRKGHKTDNQDGCVPPQLEVERAFCR